MVNNPYFYSRQSSAPSAQITDSADHPHTGLIKALSVGMTGNYAIRAADNFAITVASASTITVASGEVFRDGLKTAVSASGTLTLATTTADITYSLLVVNASNALAIRTPAGSATNVVPEYTLGDIPVALLLYTNNSATMEIQFLTTNKNVNSLDIGYADGSSEYVSKGTITATADGLFITGVGAATVTSHDKLLMQDADASDVIKTATVSSIVALSPSLSGTTNNEIVTVTGANAMQGESGLLYDGSDLKVYGGLQVGAGLEFTIAESSDDITLTNTVSDKDIIFKINDGGVNTEVMRIDGSVSRIGIGTATPSEVLDVIGTIGMGGIKRGFAEITTNTTPPPPAYSLSLTSDHTLWLETVTFNPIGPVGGALPVTVPAASDPNVGHEYQLIIKANAGGPADLTIAMTGSDVLVNEIGVTVSTPMSTVTGKIYKLLCINATHWMLQTLN